MSSEVDIANSALRKIGANTITSFLDGTSNANIVADQYENVRDYLMRAHTWNFATKLKKLARSANTPAFQWDHQYPVPSDFLRVVAVADNDAGHGVVKYEIGYDDTDGNVIFADVDELWLRYIARITDPNRMSPDFREALSFALAAEFAVSIANSNTLHDRMFDRFQRIFRRARSADGMEDYPAEFPLSSWASTRHSFTNTPFGWSD